MVERFLETLIEDLEKSCMNKELNTHIVWTRADVDLDINKCRKHCRIDSGYVWNGVLICESCTKILYGNLNRFNKSTLDLAFENYMIEDKMNDKLNNIIENMKTMQNHITNLTDKVNNYENEIKLLKDENNNLKNSINNLESEIINNDISKDDIYNNIKNNSMILENTIKANDIKYTSMIQNFQKKIDDMYIEIDNVINNKLKKIDDNKIDDNKIDDNKIDDNKIDDKQFDKQFDNKIKIEYVNPVTENNNCIDKQIAYQNCDNDIINKKILDNDIINNKNLKKMSENRIATIKVFDKCKIGGIGYILTVNTISVGNVKIGYKYQSKNGRVIFEIKWFENNFCPTEFTYPDIDILINPKFIKGNILLIDIYDEFYCIDEINDKVINDKVINDK